MPGCAGDEAWSRRVPESRPLEALRGKGHRGKAALEALAEGHELRWLGRRAVCLTWALLSAVWQPIAAF